MPIFEYICNKCKKKFEEIRVIAMAGEDAFCPKCGNSCQQVISKPGKFVRGSGQWSSPA